MQQTKPLTKAQREFLKSYVDEFTENELPRSVAGKTADEITGMKRSFVNAAAADFDGPSTPGDVRVAKNLLDAGVLSEVDDHENGLYVVFSPAGLETLFDVAVSG